MKRLAGEFRVSSNEGAVNEPAKKLIEVFAGFRR